MKKQINIFIISPSDVNSEREIARDVCNTGVIGTQLTGDCTHIQKQNLADTMHSYHPLS